MTLDFPDVDAQRATQGAHALNQALLGVRLAREELERALEAAPALPPEATRAWSAAVTARLGDLAQAAEILEHARNVLGKVGRDLPVLRERYDAAPSDDLVREAAGLLALSAEQFLRMSAPIAFPPVPEKAQPARGEDGTVVPLDARHALPDGMVLVRGRDL